MNLSKLICFAASVLVFGCDVAIPEGSLRCKTNGECPHGWQCAADERCYTNERWVAPAESMDASQDARADATATDARIDPLDASTTPAADSGAFVPPDEDAGAPVDAGPTLDAPCMKALDKGCSGHASVDKLVCIADRWEFNGSCDGDDRCNTKPGPTQGTCQPMAALCIGRQPGETVCDGPQRRRCNADLLGYDPSPCPAHAHCAGDDHASCACDSGYRYDAANGCVDIDDCVGNTCNPGRCVDGVNSHTCVCPSGYASTGTTCSNVDDCPDNTCAPGACVDGLNAYTCSCPAGYVANGTTCANVDDCPGNTCAPGNCIDGVSSYSCECPSGYIPNGTICANVDDCVGHHCSPGTCVDGLNAYTCSCPSGYTASGNTCVNIDDCAGNTCAPGACVDGVNAYSCSCPTGYSTVGNTCVNIDNCAGNSACSPGTCVDGINTYSCSCPACWADVGGACLLTCNLGGGG